jgi:hypothetical protein
VHRTGVRQIVGVIRLGCWPDQKGGQARGRTADLPLSGGCSAGRRHDSGVRVMVLADTHAPRRWRSCPAPVAELLRGVDLILHAGDVCIPA